VPDSERAELRRRCCPGQRRTRTQSMSWSSEVGCEGLDFQFCDFLVELRSAMESHAHRAADRAEWTLRPEKRDRGDQNMVTPGTVDAVIYNRCLWRIGVFTTPWAAAKRYSARSRKTARHCRELQPDREETDREAQQLADTVSAKFKKNQELENRQSDCFGQNVPKQSWKDEMSRRNRSGCRRRPFRSA